MNSLKSVRQTEMWTDSVASLAGRYDDDDDDDDDDDGDDDGDDDDDNDDDNNFVNGVNSNNGNDCGGRALHYKEFGFQISIRGENGNFEIFFWTDWDKS